MGAIALGFALGTLFTLLILMEQFHAFTEQQGINCYGGGPLSAAYCELIETPVP